MNDLLAKWTNRVGESVMDRALSDLDNDSRDKVSLLSLEVMQIMENMEPSYPV